MQTRSLLLLGCCCLFLVQPLETSGAATNNDEEKKCLCQATGCLCCVELNLTSSIDLGGPACVNVRQRERNVTINLSYADNPVHNATIGIDQAARKPTCMNLLSNLAQICAKFVSMRITSSKDQQQQQQQRSGHDGCLVIEPALLGTAQATYPVGCFNFNNGLVKQIDTVVAEEEPKPEQGHETVQQQQQQEEEEEEEETGFNAEELIAAVSEQGIAFFSQLLGFDLSPRLNVSSFIGGGGGSTSTNNGEIKNDKPINPVNGRHGRTITILGETEDKNEERLKQLLSAQDNILNESTVIGKPPRGFKTAFLYSQPDKDELKADLDINNNNHNDNNNNNNNHHQQSAAAVISPENLAVVPTESRRGGRAYNIYQHVNEV